MQTFTNADSPMATLLRPVMGAFAKFVRFKPCVIYRGRTLALSDAQAIEMQRANDGMQKAVLDNALASVARCYQYLKVI